MAPSGESLVLLQTSDWHVGSALTGPGLGYSAEFRELRRREVDQAAERAVAAAREAQADLLLVPGDLWDAESVPPASIHRIVEALASFAPRPVFISPGNHDFGGFGGWYDPELLRSSGMRSWPENVIVFRSPEWTTVPVAGRDDATVTGRACLSSAVDLDRPLASLPRTPRGPVSILLVHGSLETYPGPDRGGTKTTAPFSRQELLDARFRWAALGHHHTAAVVESEPGFPIGAYSGCPTGRGLDETGPRVFLKVTIPAAGAPAVALIPADARAVHDIVLDVSGLEGSAIREAAGALLEQFGVQANSVVRLTLAGVQPVGAHPAIHLDPSPRSVSFLRVRDRTVPERREADPRTAEGRFFLDLTARLEGASSVEEKKMIEAAIEIGRNAMAGWSFSPPPLEEF